MIRMEGQKYRGISRGRRLTSSEAEKYARIRAQEERELTPLAASPVKIAIAKLRAMRQAKGISLAQLAERTGMTRGNLARLESRKNATLRTLARYAEGLGCELEINVISAKVQLKKGRPSVMTTRR
jgi:DNA-binding Xre family transcriptional regulator